MKGFIQASKTYRYFTHGDPEKASHIVYALHGYGQLAEFFIRKFQNLSEKYFIVAPEGMHRFYLNGSSGRVGASWMTKEERELDISDNLNWLNLLDQEIELKWQFEKKIILGFSQGGATAARLYYKNNFKFDRLIIWSSAFPPDLKIEEFIEKENLKQNTFLIGNKDEFYSDDQITELIGFYNSKGFQSIIYKGKHEIETEMLMKVLS
jgi:predicted esterase